MAVFMINSTKIAVAEPARLRISKATFPWIEEHEPASIWFKAISQNRTSNRYAYNLMLFMQGMDTTPEQFLANAESNPKALSITVKSYIGSLKSRAAARSQFAALRSFIAFHEAPIPLNGLKVRVPRTRKKPYLAWHDAEKIIIESRPPYRDVFRFLLWSGLGLDELNEIQSSAEIQKHIEAQRKNSKTYIRIDLRPRKSNIDSYFALVPKQYVPTFPILTTDYGNRGKQPVSSIDAEMNWTRARRRAGIEELGLGPHTLRSSFRSECGRLGVADAVAESQMGHGSREKYGYSRETTDETYVVSELSKLWTATTPVTTEELLARDERMAKVSEIARSYLESRIRELEGYDLEHSQERWEKEGIDPDRYSAIIDGVTSTITMRQMHEEQVKELAKLKKQLALLD
jgi:integrase